MQSINDIVGSGDEPEIEDGQETVEGNPLMMDKEMRLTWSLQAVQGFNKNINPNFIRSRRERARAEALEEANSSDPFKWATIIIMVLIGGALAYYIFNSGAGQSAASSISSGASVGFLIAGRSLGSMKDRVMRLAGR